MIPIAITNDLRAGMGLEETLVKHNTSLKELFSAGTQIGNLNDWSNIQPTKYNTYRVSNQLKGKKIECGTYRTHEDAIRVRNELIKRDWDKSQLPDILEKLGIQKNGWGGHR